MKKIAVSLLLFTGALQAHNTHASLTHHSAFESGKSEHKGRGNLFSAYDFSQEETFIASLGWNQFYSKDFLTSSGIAFRENMKDFGFGLNTFWDFTNQTPVYANQIGLGMELFFDKFLVSFNNYLPLTKKADIEGTSDQVTFNRASELSLVYFLDPSCTLEVAPRYIHQESEWVIQGAVNYKFNDNLEAAFMPAYGSKEGHVGEVRFTYYFGGKPQERKYEKVHRSEKIHYQQMAKSIKPAKDKTQVKLVLSPELSQRPYKDSTVRT